MEERVIAEVGMDWRVAFVVMLSVGVHSATALHSLAVRDSLRPRTLPVQPPHCSKTPVLLAQSSKAFSDAVARGVEMNFAIGLHTTVCFRLDEKSASGNDNSSSFFEQDEKSSWLHTLRLEKLEQHHPVVQKYVFAIPEVSAECICECDASSTTCSAATHKYAECPDSDLRDSVESCYRTFFPGQAPDGCATGNNPKLCCDVRFRPYQSKSFTAVRIEQPSTFATFVYSAFDFSKGRWIERDFSRFRTQLDGSAQHSVLDSLRRLELGISAGGRASHQLESGMYFAESNAGGEMDALRQQPLNEITDNNFDRLGWYREGEDGRFHVKNGQVRLDKIHNAKVINCKDQTYRSVLDANFYMPDNFNLSRPLEELHPWMERARLFDGRARHVVVNHAEGTNLQISLQVKSEDGGRRVIFFHNSSRIADFSGSIIVDSRSNRYANLSVVEASGKLVGVVFASSSANSPAIHSFSAYVHELEAVNRSLLIPLPAALDAGQRRLCLRADDEAEEDAICRVLPYHESPLEVDMEHNSWKKLTGHCPECNQVGINGIVKYLNPLSWFDGATSVGDVVLKATDVFVYVCILVVLYIMLTKLIIPLFQCWICPLYMMNRRRSQEKKKARDRAVERQLNVPGHYV